MKDILEFSKRFFIAMLVMIASMTLFHGTTLAVEGNQVSTTSIKNLKVQATVMPLAIEDAHPVFSWQMSSTEVGQKQTAYQITVSRESDNKVIWNSNKVESGISNNIKYMGVALQPEMEYSWEVTVWDGAGKTHTESSRFETGLMNPDIYAWDGAEWIGSKKLSLDATSNLLFNLVTDFQIISGNSASLILGANDFRLNDNFLNIENVEGENYVRFEFDLSGAGTEKGAILNIYRVGYGKGDTAEKPYITVSSENFSSTNINEIFTASNKSQKHNVQIKVDASNISLIIDGIGLITDQPAQRRGPAFEGIGGAEAQGPRASQIQISNYGGGNNFNSFPNLNSVGFASNPGDEVVYSNYVIKNAGQSSENNILFDATTEANYSIFEKISGVSINGSKITVKNETNKTIIGYEDPSHGALTMVRTDFVTNAQKKIAKAKMFVTSMGSYEMYINGERMSNDWFTPGDSQFRETLCYFTYDVTTMLKDGENSMGAILNPGWYTGYMTFTPGNFNFFGDNEALLAKLVVTYDDGSKEIIVTNDDTWKAYKDGPIRYGSFFQGERYDANKEANISLNGDINGWSTSDYDGSKWSNPDIIEQRDWINFDIVSRYDEAVKVRETLTAKQVMDIHSDDSHTFTYDMGINMVGVPSITIPAGWLNKGDVVILRFGEQLYPGFKDDEKSYVDLYGKKGKNIAGRILTETYRAALSTDFYIAKNSDQVVIQPTSTYRGYQYIEITIPGHVGALPLENIKGLVLSSDKLPSGTYEATTADGKTGTLVNQLFKNIQRSQLGNFFTIPTDCPQRNERMGWTGDAQAYTRTGTYNSEAQNFFRQWMVALRADQGIGSNTEAPGGIGSTVPTYNKSDDKTFANGTTWAAAVCQVPWQLYIQYGNTQIIEENMETMMNWLNGMDFYDFSEKYTFLSGKAGGLADWLAIDGNTPPEMVNNAIYIYMMEVTAIMADAIGETQYAEILRDRHDKAKAEWNDLYVDPVSGRTRNAEGYIVHSQSSYATPLNFNAFSDENKAKAEQYLAELAAKPSLSNTNADGSRVEYPVAEGRGGFGGAPSITKTEEFLPYTITTGFSGTPNILPALSRGGKVDEAFNMFACTDYTSWLYPVTKGATSIWERWNGYEAAFAENNSNNMNSFNHFALGAVGQWMYEFQLGITSDHVNGKAGYKHFVLQPSTGANFTSLKGSYDSNYGAIISSWKADGKGTMTSYSTVVPANTTATLYLPVNATLNNFATTNGVTFKGKTTHNNTPVAEYELVSGSFEFSISASGVTVK